MAVKLADAVAFLTTDDTELKKGMSSAEREVESSGGRFGSVLQGIGISVGMGIAGIASEAVGAMVSFIGDGIGAASDLGETVSKVNTLFGDSSAGILQWAEGSANAMGLPKQAALDAVGTIGNLFMQLGASSDEAATVGQGMVQLSADLASFHNVAGGSTEVLDAMTAAFRGEYDALQRYIPTINGAAVEQQALAMSGKASADELTNLDKALAVQAIMARDAGAAIGDFARTSDGAANQQRILDANMANLQATLGQGLLPIYGALISVLNQLVQTVMPPVTAFINDRMVPAMDAIGAIIRSSVGPMIEAAMAWFTSLGDTMQTQTDGPFAYLHAWFEQNMPRIQQIVQTVLQAMTQFWQDHGAQISAVVNTLLTWMAAFWDTQMRTILDIVTAALQLLTGDWEGAGQTINGIVSRWWEFFASAFEAIRQTITSIDWGAVGQAVVDAIWDGMRNAWGGLESWFNDRLQGMRNMLPFSEPKDPSSPLRNLSASGEAIVGMIQRGINDAAGWALPQLPLPSAAGAGAAAAGAINITINVSGGDAAAIGQATKGGVLQALRQAGVR